jgi:hypothetical protein
VVWCHVVVVGWRSGERQPTSTTGHLTTCCNLQSYAPEDGQMFVRNMLNWSWRSINTAICCIQLVLLYYIACIDDARSNTNRMIKLQFVTRGSTYCNITFYIRGFRFWVTAYVIPDFSAKNNRCEHLGNEKFFSFRPHPAFVCFVWFSAQTAIILSSNVNRPSS